VLDAVAGFHREAQHFGVEPFGPIELVSDDLDVVDPLNIIAPDFR
jgi:hypothetical protein